MPQDNSTPQSKRELKKAAKHLAKLKSAKYGSKQGERMIQGYIVEGKNVGANYESPSGVKAKDIPGAEPIYSKYGKPVGTLGGAVSRQPIKPVNPPITPPTKQPELKEPGVISRKFDSYGRETEGINVSGASSEELAKAVNEALTKNPIGKDMSIATKEFKEAPEFERNEAMRVKSANNAAKRLAEKKASKYVKGSRTQGQVEANQEARSSAQRFENAGRGKEGSRKLFRALKNSK